MAKLNKLRINLKLKLKLKKVLNQSLINKKPTER